MRTNLTLSTDGEGTKLTSLTGGEKRRNFATWQDENRTTFATRWWESGMSPSDGVRKELTMQLGVMGFEITRIFMSMPTDLLIVFNLIKWTSGKSLNRNKYVSRDLYRQNGKSCQISNKVRFAKWSQNDRKCIVYGRMNYMQYFEVYCHIV